MAQVSIAEAARLTGKSRRTIERHFESGKLSFTLNVAGVRQVEISELTRVYGSLSQTVARHVVATCQTVSHDTVAPDTTEIRQRLAVLEAENKLLRERIEDKDKHIANIMGLLEHKKPSPSSWWQIWKPRL